MISRVEREEAMAGPFKPTYRPSPTHKNVPTRPSKFDEILFWYEYQFQFNWGINLDTNHSTILKHLKGTSITATEIQEFALLTQSYEAREQYPIITGIFLTALMQRCHEDGENDFYFDFSTLKPLENFARHMSEKEGQSLRVMVEGNEIFGFADYAYKGTYYCDKGEAVCGHQSQNITVYAHNIAHYGPWYAPDIHVYTPDRAFAEWMRLRNNLVTIISQSDWDTTWNTVKSEILGGKR